MAPLSEPGPVRLQVTPLGSFVAALTVVLWPPKTLCDFEEIVTVIGGVVFVDEEEPHPGSMDTYATIAAARNCGKRLRFTNPL